MLVLSGYPTRFAELSGLTVRCVKLLNSTHNLATSVTKIHKSLEEESFSD